MEMSNKKQQIPAIRFNGFTDAWEQRKLEKIFGKIRNAFVGTATPYYVENGHFYLESNNVKDGKINRNSEIFINDEFYERQRDKWLHTNDLVMVQSGHVGHTAVIPEELDGTAAHALIMFQDYKVKSNPYFLNYQLHTSESKKKLEYITTGNTIKHILASEMKKFEVTLPNFEEQTKIGTFFKHLDDTIALHQRQLDNYKELQKSLLQKIFNQELRFKDKYGDDYPEWEKEKLGNLITEVVEKSTIQDQYPILSSTNKGLFLQSEYFKSNIASDDNIGYKILRQNEIVFSPQNLWMGNINFNDKYEAGIVSPSYKIFSVNDGIVHEFMKFMIKTQYMMNEYVLSSEQGASIVRRNLDMELFNKIKVKIPTIPEQKKITDFLIASDDQIDQVAQKLERLKEQKKGLMQRMFV